MLRIVASVCVNVAPLRHARPREVSRACEDRGLEPFSADDVRGYRTGRHQGSLVDIQTKKELWVLAISTSAVPLMAGVAAFLIR